MKSASSLNYHVESTKADAEFTKPQETKTEEVEAPVTPPATETVVEAPATVEAKEVVEEGTVAALIESIEEKTHEDTQEVVSTKEALTKEETVPSAEPPAEVNVSEKPREIETSNVEEVTNEEPKDVVADVPVAPSVETVDEEINNVPAEVKESKVESEETVGEPEEAKTRDVVTEAPAEVKTDGVEAPVEVKEETTAAVPEKEEGLVEVEKKKANIDTPVKKSED
ncbi:hypothetical protein GIB67_013359 [Kingdonia uniflora]|uniref:Uncharacterized protein n=1 Tax=Kingdonia uniflora TaxID=39325 RepID=A0A7J7LR35_9MAGN|nr:hypothetical protein GIB67_013359 [Kingdonia uniflora]